MRRAVTGAAPAASEALWSANGAVSPGTPPPDWAITTYSAESLDAFAGNDTHPESAAGSIAAYAPTASARSVAKVALQGGATGPAAESLVHAAAAAVPRSNSHLIDAIVCGNYVPARYCVE